jgi:hypothetical protein
MSNGGTVSVTATILGNAIVDIPNVPWTSGMNAQQALEAAYNLRTDKNYGFSVAYYGEPFGYFLEEIERIGDQPGVYWEFFVNGTWSSTGIDTTILNAGDAIAFEYQYYDPNQPESNPQLAAKHERKASAP